MLCSEFRRRFLIAIRLWNPLLILSVNGKAALVWVVDSNDCITFWKAAVVLAVFGGRAVL